MKELDTLQARYAKVADRIKEIELENAMKKKKLQENRDEIVKLGFDPDKLDTQIPAIKQKIQARLQEIEVQVDLLYVELGLGNEKQG